jgi:hypothetical protein
MVANGADDLFGIWRSLLQQWESQTNAALGKVTGEEAFSREMHRNMAVGLKLQAAFNEAVEKALSTLNLPSRDDIARLSEQIRVLEAKIDTLTPAKPNGEAPSPKARTARTRRPPNAGART